MVLEMDIIKKIMQKEKLSSFIVKNLRLSLEEIGFSESFINDLLDNFLELDINPFQKRHSEELRRVYTKGFFQDIVPDYFENYIFPEIEGDTIIDVGCGTGILAKRLDEKGKVRKIIGIDINAFAIHPASSRMGISGESIKELLSVHVEAC